MLLHKVIIKIVLIDLLFNLFISHLLAISISKALSNYADDNNLYNTGKNFGVAKSNFRTEFNLVNIFYLSIYLFIYLFILF